ncbi:MAG TPA: TetR/AcrR family transcriptional regulator [Longilinea sp.]|nr:TetR/AcrR family transcriptional regulator [Longilinea sp.]
MQQRSEETQSKILDSAELLFSSHGYDAASVAEICSAAGVSKGAFYHHFPSKQAVFMAILNRWLGGLDKQMANALSMAGNVPDGLVEMAGLTRDVFQVGSGRLPMLLEFWTQSLRDPEIWKITIEPYRHYHAMFTDIIRRGQQEGSLAPVDPNLAAVTVVALAMGMLLQGVMDPHANAWDKVTKKSMSILVEGLKRRQS